MHPALVSRPPLQDEEGDPTEEEPDGYVECAGQKLPPAAAQGENGQAMSQVSQRQRFRRLYGVLFTEMAISDSDSRGLPQNAACKTLVADIEGFLIHQPDEQLSGP